jgi:hypothetical protein
MDDLSLTYDSWAIEETDEGDPHSLESLGTFFRLRQMLGDVLGLPEKGGMLADAFDDFRLFGEQELRLILAGSDGFEVRDFALVIEHRFEKRQNGFQHLVGGWPIIGSEERIEKPFEFLLIQHFESIYAVRTEVMVHSAGEENREFSEQFGS